jgi:hypothetical protein
LAGQDVDHQLGKPDRIARALEAFIRHWICGPVLVWKLLPGQDFLDFVIGDTPTTKLSQVYVAERL